MDGGVDKLVGQLEKLKEEKSAMLRSIQELDAENGQLKNVVQERTRWRGDTDNQIRQLSCSSSARSGRVNSLQDIFDNTRRSGAEVQIKAEEHVVAMEQEQFRRIDALGRYEARLLTLMKPLEDSILNNHATHPEKILNKIQTELTSVQKAQQFHTAELSDLDNRNLVQAGADEEVQMTELGLQGDDDQFMEQRNYQRAEENGVSGVGTGEGRAVKAGEVRLGGAPKAAGMSHVSESREREPMLC